MSDEEYSNVSMQSLNEATKEKLRQTVARIERLEEEKTEVAQQIKDVYAEAKAFGFDVKALRQIIKIRKTDRQEREEQEICLLYTSPSPQDLTASRMPSSA